MTPVEFSSHAESAIGIPVLEAQSLHSSCNRKPLRSDQEKGLDDQGRTPLWRLAPIGYETEISGPSHCILCGRQSHPQYYYRSPSASLSCYTWRVPTFSNRRLAWRKSFIDQSCSHALSHTGPCHAGYVSHFKGPAYVRGRLVGNMFNMAGKKGSQPNRRYCDKTRPDQRVWSFISIPVIPKLKPDIVYPGFLWNSRNMVGGR